MTRAVPDRRRATTWSDVRVGDVLVCKAGRRRVVTAVSREYGGAGVRLLDTGRTNCIDAGSLHRYWHEPAMERTP